MMEAVLTISLMVNESYNQEDVDQIVDDLEKIIGMDDSGDIRWSSGSAEII